VPELNATLDTNHHGQTNGAPPQMRVAPTVGAAEAIRRHWPTVVVTTLVLLAAGIAAGLARTPIYTATSELAIGRIDVNSPGSLAGFTQATESLATSYSRAIGATQVVSQTAAAVKESPDWVTSSLSATPVPQSPIFRISAKASSAKRAVETANAATTALTGYVSQLNSSNPDSTSLYRRFTDAARRASLLQTDQQSAQKAYQDHPSADTKSALADANARVNAAQLQLQALRTNYESSVAGQASTSLIQPLTTPTKASSDRNSKLEIYGFAGLLAGLLLGSLIVTRRATRRLRLAAA
jgi:hypothetical protein